MPYSPPTQQQILADGINTFSSLNPTVNDMNPGSVVRSLLTAHSIMLKRAYSSQAENTQVMQQIGMYQAFNFSLLQPVAAYTMEQISAAAPAANVTVPAGTIFTIPGTNTKYQTIASFTWPAGSTFQTLRIVCMQTGTIGNTPAATITGLPTPITGLSNVTVTNTRAVVNGANLETAEQRAVRFTDFLPSIHKGDIASLNYGARQAVLYDQYGYVQEQVVNAMVVQGAGTNTIYIDNGTYNTSSALVAQCQQVINGYYDSNGNPIIGYKAAGVPCTVQAANIQGIGITASVTPANGYTLAQLETTITNNLAALVQGLGIAGLIYGSQQGALLMAAINLAIGNVVGVQNYTVTFPATDTIPAPGTLLKLTGVIL